MGFELWSGGKKEKNFLCDAEGKREKKCSSLPLSKFSVIIKNFFSQNLMLIWEETLSEMFSADLHKAKLEVKIISLFSFFVVCSYSKLTLLQTHTYF